MTTVFDLMLAQYGVTRPDLPGDWPASYEDADAPATPAWQETHTSVPAAACVRIAREFARTAERSKGRCMILMGAGTNHWFHSETIYRGFWPCSSSPAARAATAAAGRTTWARRSAVR